MWIRCVRLCRKWVGGVVHGPVGQEGPSRKVRRFLPKGGLISKLNCEAEDDVEPGVVKIVRRPDVERDS